jgi:hypothetical protein
VLRYRKLEKPIQKPDPHSEVATNPFIRNGKELSNGNGKENGKENGSRTNHILMPARQTGHDHTRTIFSTGR